MRIRKQVKDMKVGELAFLPFFGRLQKSKILKVDLIVNGQWHNIHYKTLSGSCSDVENMCTVRSNSEYEVYVRLPRART